MVQLNFIFNGKIFITADSKKVGLGRGGKK